MVRKTIVLMTVALFFATAFATVNSEAAISEDEEFIDVSDNSTVPPTLPKGATWDTSGNNNVLTLNGVTVDYIYVESTLRPLVVVLNGDNYVKLIDGGMIGSAVTIISDYDVTIRGGSLSIDISKFWNINGIRVVTLGYTNESLKCSIEETKLTVIGYYKTSEEIIKGNTNAINCSHQLYIKDSLLFLSDFYGGILVFNDVLAINNSYIEFNNPPIVDDNMYKMLYCEHGVIKCDFKPISSEGEIVCYNTSGEKAEWGADIFEIDVTNAANIGVFQNTSENNLPMQIVVIACILVAIISLGYALFAKK